MLDNYLIVVILMIVLFIVAFKLGREVEKYEK